MMNQAFFRFFARGSMPHAKFHGFTLTLQKSRMPQIQGIKGEAVVLYAEPLITREMRYPRLSRRVNNRTNQKRFNDATFGGFQVMGHKARESPMYLGFLQASSCCLCNIRVYLIK